MADERVDDSKREVRLELEMARGHVTLCRLAEAACSSRAALCTPNQVGLAEGGVAPRAVPCGSQVAILPN